VWLDSDESILEDSVPAWAAIDKGADPDARASFSARLATEPRISSPWDLQPNTHDMQLRFSGKLKGGKSSSFILGYVQTATANRGRTGGRSSSPNAGSGRQPELDQDDPADPAHLSTPGGRSSSLASTSLSRLTKVGTSMSSRRFPKKVVKTGLRRASRRARGALSTGAANSSICGTFNRAHGRGPNRSGPPFAFKGPASSIRCGIAGSRQEWRSDRPAAHTAADLMIVPALANAITGPGRKHAEVYAEKPGDIPGAT